MMKPMSHPSLRTTFCDDSRQEVTGKLLYVGVFKVELIAPAYRRRYQLLQMAAGGAN